MTDRVVVVRPEPERVAVTVAGITQAQLDAAVGDKVASDDVTTIVVLTQAAYDGLAVKDPATLYIIES